MKILDVYRMKTFDLVRSLTIKSIDIAEQINQYLISAYGPNSVDLNNPYTWKYYLNLNGQYTVYDTMMTVTAIEDGSTINFTKTDLASYPLTLKTYRTNQSLRRDLIRRYPSQELLINGILNPVDLATTIDADDHQILYYDDRLVEPQEYDLISELQKYLYRYRDRWHVRGFTVSDSLYMATYWSILHTRLISAVMNIRQKFARTVQAHSFFVYQYLASHHELTNIIGNMQEEVIFFLYKNLDAINRVVGKRLTLIDIVNYILAKEGYQVKTHELTATSAIEFDGFVYPIGRVTNYNSEDITSVYEDLDSILYKETSDNKRGGIYGFEDLGYLQDKTKWSLKRMARLNIPTKTLVIDKESILSILNIDINRLIVDQWVYSVFTDKLTDLVAYKDPNTGILYTLTQREAFILFINLIATKYKVPDPIMVRWDCLYIVPMIDVNYLSAYLQTNSGLDGILAFIVDNIVPLDYTVNSIQLRNYTHTLLNNLLKLQVYIANQHDDFDHGTVKQLAKRILIPVTVSFDYPTSNLKTLYDNNRFPDITSNDYNIDKSIVSLLETVTGFKLPLVVDQNSKIVSDLLDHITAYTTQPLVSIKMRKLGNAEMGFSRLSPQLRNLLSPIIESDCLPARTGPMVYAECGEIYFDASALCFDAVIHKADFTTANITTTNECNNFINYQIQQCDITTNDYNDIDCEDYNYINAGSCECYLSYTVEFCVSYGSYTIEFCTDMSTIIPSTCDPYDSFTTFRCIDSQLHVTPSICMYYTGFTAQFCTDETIVTPFNCNNTDTITLMAQCEDNRLFTPAMCISYTTISPLRCNDYDYKSPTGCFNLDILTPLGECYELPDYLLTIECICRI